MTLEEKAKEWQKNYKPMGVTCVERYDVTVETQSKPTRIIKNPNPFRIKDGWYDLYLKDLENAYLAGAKENNIQWHDLQKDPNDLPKENKRYLCKIKAFVGGGISYECFDYDTKYNSWKDANGDVIAWKEIVPPKDVEE